jgi:hypothetical protein
MYEVLVAWESDDILVEAPPFIADFAAIGSGRPARAGGRLSQGLAGITGSR